MVFSNVTHKLIIERMAVIEDRDKIRNENTLRCRSTQGREGQFESGQTRSLSSQNGEGKTNDKSFLDSENEGGRSLSVTVEINLLAWLLFFVAFTFRLWTIDYPRSVV